MRVRGREKGYNYGSCKGFYCESLHSIATMQAVMHIEGLHTHHSISVKPCYTKEAKEATLSYITDPSI